MSALDRPVRVPPAVWNGGVLSMVKPSDVVEAHNARTENPADHLYTLRGEAVAIFDALIRERDEACEEVERLRAWKASAMEVMSGLQELGEAVGAPLGASITTAAIAEAMRLRAALREIAAETGTPYGRIASEALGEKP